MHVLILPSSHFVVPKAPLGSIFQFEQGKALARAGLRVGVISVGLITLRHAFSPFPYRARETRDGMEVFRRYRRTLFVERLLAPGAGASRYVRMFDREYARYTAECGRPDIVHAHNFMHAGLLAAHLKHTQGVPFVLTEHSSAFGLGKIPARADADLRTVAEHAGALTCVGEVLRAHLTARVGKEFQLLPNIVDPEFFTANTQVRTAEPFVFISVGRLDENKNHALAIRAFADGFRGTPVQLRIAGEGPQRDSLVRLTRACGVERQVRFLGRLTRREVRDAMRAAHCFVLPSNHETFGVVLAEAMASGLPVVATRCGGAQDIVHEGNGLLVDVGAVGQMQRAMQTMMAHAGRYDRDALVAEAKVRFGEDAFVQRAVAQYRSVVA